MLAKAAPPGNRTRVARMGILHDTTTLAAHALNKRDCLIVFYHCSTCRASLIGLSSLVVKVPPNLRAPTFRKLL